MGRDTVRSLLAAARESLAAAGVADPGTEAETLLGHVLGLDRGGLLVRKEEPVPEPSTGRFLEMVRRRAERVPPQYLTGRQEFYGRDFAVDTRVLVPRPETELLVERALALLPDRPATAVDLGTGSGCIAVTLLAERSGLEMVAVDRSKDALDVAEHNARTHRVHTRLACHLGDMTDLPGTWDRRFDLAVSNPPYVTAEDWTGLQPEVRDHEPQAALVPEGGPERMYRELARTAWRILRPGGSLVLELGYDSAGHAAAAVESAGFRDTLMYPDFQDILRVLVATRERSS